MLTSTASTAASPTFAYQYFKFTKSMEYKQLGQTALHISQIGFGCMSLSIDDTESEALLQTAFEAGINYFDTADLYNKGENEKLVGRALKKHRDKVVIATKVGNQWRNDGSGWDWNPSRKYIMDAVEKSLQRLGTDYIDVYQLHGGTINDPIDETIDAFERLVQSGKIRYYGISSIRPNVISTWAARSNIKSVMLQYSLLDRRPEEAALPLLQQKGIAVLARGSLAQGLLINKMEKQYLKYSTTAVAAAAAAVKSLVTPTRNETGVALQFVLQHPAVTAAVVGIRTAQQLKDALAASAAPSLRIAEIQHLQQALPVNIYEEHRT